MTVLGHFINELHAKRPNLLIGLAMSEEAIGVPAQALVKYGQDLLEASRAGFDFFIFSWRAGLVRPGDSAGLLKRLKDFMPDQNKIVLRVELDNGPGNYDFSEIGDLSLAFKGTGDSFEWMHELSSTLFSSRPTP
jgi:hypothetical protein